MVRFDLKRDPFRPKCGPFRLKRSPFCPDRGPFCPDLGPFSPWSVLSDHTGGKVVYSVW